MSNYHVLPLATADNDYIWCVMENQTDQLIRAFEFEDDANEYCHFLEYGGAFAGFTPSFVLREVVLSQDVNREFASFLTE